MRSMTDWVRIIIVWILSGWVEVEQKMVGKGRRMAGKVMGLVVKVRDWLKVKTWGRVVNVWRYAQEVREDRQTRLWGGWKATTWNWLVWGDRQGIGHTLTLAIREGDESRRKVWVQAEAIAEIEKLHGYRWGTDKETGKARGWSRLISEMHRLAAWKWLNRGVRGVENRKEAWMHTSLTNGDNAPNGEEIIMEYGVNEPMSMEDLRAITERFRSGRLVVPRGQGKTAADRMHRELMEKQGYQIIEVPGVGWKAVKDGGEKREDGGDCGDYQREILEVRDGRGNVVKRYPRLD